MRLSVVIPTLNEEDRLAVCLEQACSLGDQVCVSDGGSRDRTLNVAERFGTLIVQGPAGRGGQLNRGARATDGEALLFLHADTRLPADARRRIERCLAEGRLGGGFHVRYDDGSPWLRRVGNPLIRRRTAWTGWPLGDQGQFVTREAFETLDGFQDWPILEDLDFIRRLRRLGPTAVLDPTAITSPRRFDGQGLMRTTATNWLIWALYFAGASPRRLARLYRHIR